jgi:hypothetical protein
MGDAQHPLAAAGDLAGDRLSMRTAAVSSGPAPTLR